MLPQLLNIHHKCGAVCPNELVTTTTKAMNRFTLRLFLFCMAIGCAISGSAQTKVTGRVLDENRQGVDADREWMPPSSCWSLLQEMSS